MRRAALVATGLAATLLLACATPARETSAPLAAAGSSAIPPRPSTHKDQSMPAAAQDQALLPGARDAAQRVLTFLSDAKSTADFTVANIGQQLSITLGPDTANGEGWFVYRSPDLGKGWIYGVQVAAAAPSLKPGFRFWFYHPNRAADAAPVCALPLDRLRATLTAHGYVERTVPSEIGSVLAVEFAKGDIVVSLTPRDGATVGDTACVLSLQTTDGV